MALTPFPNLPGKGESPWYAKRKEWDYSVESRIQNLESRVDEGPTDWGLVLRSDNYSKVVETKNADYEAQEGELVLYKETPTLVAPDPDISQSSGNPLGFAGRIGEGTWESLPNAHTPRGRYVRTSNIGPQRYMEWAAVRPLADIYSNLEIVLLATCSDDLDQLPGIVFHANTEYTEGSVWRAVGNDRHTLRYREDSEDTILYFPILAKDFNSGWTFIRMRVYEGSFKVKMWKRDDPEPDWDVVTDYERLGATGGIGIRSLAGTKTNTHGFAFMSVSFDGGRAPLPWGVGPKVEP